MEQQLQKLFWDSTPNRAYDWLGIEPTPEELEAVLSPDNSNLPLNRIIVSPDNEGNMRTLQRFVHTAFKRENHSCRGCNFGIFAQSGQGKTYIVKCFAETVKLPLVFVQSSVLADSWMLWQLICEAGQKAGTPIVPCKNGTADYMLPPMIIFFDEAHAIPRKMMRGGLLNAMEPDDGLLQIRQPGVKGNSFMVNCQKVCWVAATTEKGLLFDAFANRLGTYLEWAPANQDEAAKIVKMNIDKRHENGEFPFSMPLEVCSLVARYQKVPREAIAFAVKVIQQRDMKSDTWESACEIVAHDIGLDQWGFNEKQTAILTALGQRPIAESRLAVVAKCRIEQVQRYELPPLMAYDNGGPLVVTVSGKGMAITAAGLKELDKRGITHKGHRVTAEYFEMKRAES